jgi:uncharacterized protein YwqG
MKEMNILQELLDTEGLRRVSSEIMRVALPSIRLRASSVDEADLELGATKFGGAPDLPQGFQWPEWDGSPLPFVAQFRLSEATLYDPWHVLPTEGVLYFFIDFDNFLSLSPPHQDMWKVLYEPTEHFTLQRAVIPENIASNQRYRPSTVTYSTEITLPDYSEYDPTSLERLGLSEPLTDEEESAYYHIQQQLNGTDGSRYHTPIHRLLGHADVIQWDMHRELEGSATDWQLLLQVDSDDAPDTEWGDTGRIYYWIRTRDLMRKDFSAVVLIEQST